MLANRRARRIGEVVGELMMASEFSALVEIDPPADIDDEVLVAAELWREPSSQMSCGGR
jgi:hypothetical protein